MSAMRYTHTDHEPVTARDWLDTYAARAFERLGGYLARHADDTTATQLTTVARAYALVSDAPMSRGARYDLRATRRSLLASIDELDRRANLRLAGLATVEEHHETLGALAEHRELLAAVDLVLVDMQS